MRKYYQDTLIRHVLATFMIQLQLTIIFIPSFALPLASSVLLNNISLRLILNFQTSKLAINLRLSNQDILYNLKPFVFINAKENDLGTLHESILVSHRTFQLTHVY